MRCYRRLLNISYKDHVTNNDVRKKIQAATGKYDELLTLVKKRKLRWFGRVSVSSGCVSVSSDMSRCLLPTCMGNCCSPGCRLGGLWWCLFVLSFFPRGVLDEILKLNWVSFWGFSFLLLQRQFCRAQCKEIEEKGRQKKRWEDNIKEWTGMDLLAQLGQLKTGLSVKSSVVPQLPHKVMR